MKLVRLCALLGAALYLAACASPADVGKMVVTAPASGTLIDPAMSGAIAVGSVTGGKETSPLWTSQVASGDFASALEISLSKHGLLAPTKPGAFTLDANLIEMDQPFLGFDMTVTSHVNYSLFDTATRKPVLQETVTASFTATPGDAILGVTRLKRANEGSIRTNIKQFLDKLYKP